MTERSPTRDSGEHVPLISMRLTEWIETKSELNALQAAVKHAYEILCSGNLPHSARESNARRVLRQALGNQNEQ